MPCGSCTPVLARDLHQWVLLFFSSVVLLVRARLATTKSKFQSILHQTYQWHSCTKKHSNKICLESTRSMSKMMLRTPFTSRTPFKRNFCCIQNHPNPNAMKNIKHTSGWFKTIFVEYFWWIFHGLEYWIPLLGIDAQVLKTPRKIYATAVAVKMAAGKKYGRNLWRPLMKARLVAWHAQISSYFVQSEKQTTLIGVNPVVNRWAGSARHVSRTCLVNIPLFECVWTILESFDSFFVVSHGFW